MIKLLIAIQLLSTFITIKVSLSSCGSVRQVYPSLTPYHELSCVCLPEIGICEEKLMIRFEQMSIQQTLYYKLSEPLVIEEIQLQSSVYEKNIKLPVKKQGQEVSLIFKYANSKDIELHFGFYDQLQAKPPKQNDYSFLILTACTTTMTILLATFTRIRRFEAVQIRWYFALVYSVLVGVFIVLLNLQPGVFIYFQQIMVGIFAFLCTAFYCQEVMTALGLKYKIYRLFLKDIVAVSISLVLVAVWLWIGNNWVMNDVFGMFIIGSALKVLKIRSLRASLFFLLMILFLDAGLELVFRLTGSGFSSKLINQYPSALELQIPTLTFFTYKRCTWVEISDVIFPGLLISYCRRIDDSLNSSIYAMLSYFTVIGTAILQIGVYYFGEIIQLPQALISIPLIIILLMAVSFRRGEFSLIWFGGFYDKLEDRISLEKTVIWEGLTKDMDKGLLIN